MSDERFAGIPHEIALDKMATTLGLDTDALITYTQDDPWGGYSVFQEDGFPVGSMWRVEGKTVYALIRALKPANVLELGTSRGCSATHILQALFDNGDGHLDCVDHAPAEIVGDFIPPKFRGRVDIHLTDMNAFVANLPDQSYDFILEDGNHDSPQVEMVYRAAWRLLRPGGVIVSHDPEHFLAGAAVRAGIAQAGYRVVRYKDSLTRFADDVPTVHTVLIAPSDCGLAYYRKPIAAETVEVAAPPRKQKAK